MGPWAALAEGVPAGDLILVAEERGGLDEAAVELGGQESSSTGRHGVAREPTPAVTFPDARAQSSDNATDAYRVASCEDVIGSRAGAVSGLFSNVVGDSFSVVGSVLGKLDDLGEEQSWLDYELLTHGVGGLARGGLGIWGCLRWRIRSGWETRGGVWELGGERCGVGTARWAHGMIWAQLMRLG